MRKIVICCIILAICSCKKNNDNSGTQPPAPLLQSNVSSTMLGASTGSKDSLSITSNINWTIALNPSTATWASLSSSSGNGDAKIYITATQDNVSGFQRSANIILTPVGTTSISSVNIVVTQNFQSPILDTFWKKTLGGSGKDQSNAIIPTADGGYMMAGYTDSNDGEVTSSHGGGDAWIVKLSSSGGITWQKTLGGTGYDRAYSVVAAPDGGYAFAGQTTSTDGDVTGLHGAQPDMWVVKLDNSGNILWQKTLGGTRDDIAYSLVATPDGGYAVVGRTLSSDGDATGSHGDADVLVVKLNGNGDVIWKKVIGGSAQDVGFSIITTSDDGYIVTGNTASIDGDISGVHGGLDALAVKLDSDGNIVWQKAFGGTYGEQARSIVATNDGGYILAGNTFSNDGDVSGNHGSDDGWILKIDSSGILQWQKPIGGMGDDYFNCINVNSQGQFTIAGASTSNDGDVSTNNGDMDFWIIQVDADGNILGKKSFGGTGAEEAMGIVSRSDGIYITAGNTGSNDGDVSGNHGGISDGWIVNFKFQ